MIELYESQRAMRNMRKAAMQRGVIAILDVGSSKIACLVLRFDGSNASDDGVGSLAGQSGFRVIGAATTRSRGVRFGEIHSMSETERAIRTAVQAAQKMAGIRVDHVIAAFSGAGPRSYGLAGAVDVQGVTVDEQDVARVLSACDVPDFGHGREVLHAQPVNFALDHRSGLIDPRGQIGNELSCDMHMLTVDAQAIQNLPIVSSAAIWSWRALPQAHTHRVLLRWSRMNKSWARPASTWAAARRASRSS
jgi:cell division protein FtsA